MQTVAYADVFDYPLTADEIHRYLIGAPAAAAPCAASLGNGAPASRTLLGRSGRYFTLAGRESVVETRRGRATACRRPTGAARVHYGRIIGGLPFVRMVAVTGALAMDNVADGDIDYLIVTEPGRLWLCRALVVGVVRAAALRGVELCPNYFLSEHALVLEERNLFTAHEVAQMVPLRRHGDVPAAARAQPLDRDAICPTPAGPPRRIAAVRADAMPAPGGSSKRTLRSRVARPIEHWEMTRKMRKLGAQSDGPRRGGVRPRLVQGPLRRPRPVDAGALRRAPGGPAST